MMRSFTLLFLVCFAYPAMADLQQQIDEAKEKLRQATQKLDDAKDREKRCEDREDDLRRRANLVAAEADRLNDEALRIEQNRLTAQNAIFQLQQDCDAARQAMPALEDAFKSARGAQDVIARAAAQRVTAMESEFQSSDALRNAVQRVAEIEESIQLRTDEVKKALAAEPAYRALREEADKLKIEVESQRKTSGADAQLLASKSQTWMTAETRAGEMVKVAEQGDEELKGLRQAMAAARKAEKKVLDDFEQSRRDDPALVQLAADAQASALAVRAAESNLRTAQARVTDSEDRLRAARTLIATAEADAASARIRAQSLRNDHSNLLRELDWAQNEHRQAEYQRDRAEKEVQQAAAKLRKLIEQQPPRTQ